MGFMPDGTNQLTSLNHCWLTISTVQWQSSQDNFTGDTSEICYKNRLYNHSDLPRTNEFLCDTRSISFTNTQIAKFIGLTWGPPGPCRPQLAPCWLHEPCNQGRFAPRHSVESPSMVDPQWDIWYWGSKWNLHTVCWSAVGCEWGTTSVYFGIIYVCIVPSRLSVFAVEPQYQLQDFLFLSKV